MIRLQQQTPIEIWEKGTGEGRAVGQNAIYRLPRVLAVSPPYSRGHHPLLAFCVATRPLRLTIHQVAIDSSIKLPWITAYFPS